MALDALRPLFARSRAIFGISMEEISAAADAKAHLLLWTAVHMPEHRATWFMCLQCLSASLICKAGACVLHARSNH